MLNAPEIEARAIEFANLPLPVRRARFDFAFGFVRDHPLAHTPLHPYVCKDKITSKRIVSFLTGISVLLNEWKAFLCRHSSEELYRALVVVLNGSDAVGFSFESITLDRPKFD